MDIRYFKMTMFGDYYGKDFYIAASDQGVFRIGKDRFYQPESEKWRAKEYYVKNNYAEIKHAPDPDGIEDHYINATDRPSREGFKHPDVVEPWS